jgi:hypothetical protein
MHRAGEHAHVIVCSRCTVTGVLLTRWQGQRMALTLADLPSSAQCVQGSLSLMLSPLCRPEYGQRVIVLPA